MNMSMQKTALVTGICGQAGSYLQELLLGRSYKVVGTTHRKEAVHTSLLQESVKLVYLDLTDALSIEQVVKNYKPCEIYLLASRSSSSQLADDPIATAHVNGLSTLYFLEAMRKHCPGSKLCYVASSEVFAGVATYPQNEDTPLSPVNFYGAAKAFGVQYVDMYRRLYGLHCSAAISYNHESERRPVHYVTRKITNAAALIYRGRLGSLVLGSLDSQRDWTHASDIARAYWLITQQTEAQNFVLGSGVLHSVGEVCEIAFSSLGLDYRQYVEIVPDDTRRAETTPLVADTRRAHRLLNWSPSVSFSSMIEAMVAYDLENSPAQ